MTDPQPHLNLDTLEREAVKEPFTFVLGGRTFTMLGPDEADWQIQANLEADDADSLRAYIGDLLGGGDAYDAFATVRLPVWKMDRLIEACKQHYGADVPE